LTPEAADDLSRELVSALARLHGLTPPRLPAGRSLSSIDYLHRQVARWTDQWERNKTRELPAFSELARWLNREINGLTFDYPISIVHGDYRIDNLVLDAGSHRVRAVLDWEMSTLGDPMIDIALLMVYWEQPDDRSRTKVRVARGLTTPPGFWTREQLLDHYLEATNLPTDHLSACLALACLKLAAILEGIHRRYQAGHALDALSAGLAGAAPALVDMGLLVASGHGVASLTG
jgi:aminoglycoside phosphotransferase (APT) family kinase protein